MAQYEYNNPRKNFWKKVREINPDRWIELLFAGAVVYFAFQGFKNSQATNEQTNQLISAAKISAYAASQNVQASRNFADSAHSINKGISDAVGKLNLQAGALSTSAQEGDVLAKQTQRLAEDSEKTLHVTERAYIGLVVIGHLPKPGNLIFPDSILKNVGKTIAVHVRAKAFGNFGGNPTPKEEMDNPLNDDGSVENEIPEIPFSISASDPYVPIMTKKDYDDIWQMKRQITVYGRVDYEDTFGFSHWITYCRHSLIDGGWEGCGPKYNQTDKNQQ